jgi:hypothetical protein
MQAGMLINRSLNIGIVHLDADMPFKFFVRVVRWDIRRARRLALEGLVVVIPEVRGFPPPDVMARKDMVIEWAEGARESMIEDLAQHALVARIRLAIVVPEHYIDFERIGVRIGAMHGLTGCVVTTEQEAIDWMVATRQRAPAR